jgi:NAD(P)-dependent dehydrogenase (short-subunit alcohol dehydrogenase family)
MGKFDGKAVLITGGARGQGRSHALQFAKEGADIVVADIAEQIETVPYTMSNESQLAETVKLVEEYDQRCVSVKGDMSRSEDVQHLVQQESGRIIATSSMAGRTGLPTVAHYCAAKWGVIGLVKSVAREVAGQGVTVNAICPTNCDTDMIHNQPFYELFAPDVENPTKEQAVPGFLSLNAIPVPWIDPIDISNAMMFLASDEARYITGEALHVSAGWNAFNAA